MTYEHPSPESVLATDCGSTVTRVFLIDQVEGRYRPIACAQAPSSVGTAQPDMVDSVRQALGHLSEMTGWRFLEGQSPIASQQHTGAGVGAVVTITSVADPLRLVLVGISHQASLETALSVLPLAYAKVEGLASASRGDGDVLFDDYEGHLRLIQELAPEAVVLVGGLDGGAEEPVLQSARVLAWGYSKIHALEDTRPPVIFAGNTELGHRVTNILEPVTTVQTVDNVRPSLEEENPGPLQVAVMDLQRQEKLEKLPGFETLAAWSTVPVVPAAQSFAHSMQYLARSQGINALGVDVGGTMTTAVSVVDGQPTLVVRPDLGLSHHASRILDSVPAQSLLRWLPMTVDASDLHDALYNKSAYPYTLPQTRHDLLLEQAVAREVLGVVLANLPTYCSSGTALNAGVGAHHLIVGSGGVLGKAPVHGQAALILLDALQPVGVCGLALDCDGLLAVMGAVARLNPLAAAQVVDYDALLKLGTAIIPGGTAPEGEVALSFKIEYNDGRSLEVEATHGSLQVIPLPAGQTARLELRPGHHLDTGWETPGQNGSVQVEGGAIGLIVDARGRPLPVAKDRQEQRARVQRWLSALGA